MSRKNKQKNQTLDFVNILKFGFLFTSEICYRKI